MPSKEATKLASIDWKSFKDLHPHIKSDWKFFFGRCPFDEKVGIEKLGESLDWPKPKGQKKKKKRNRKRSYYEMLDVDLESIDQDGDELMGVDALDEITEEELD